MLAGAQVHFPVCVESLRSSSRLRSTSGCLASKQLCAGLGDREPNPGYGEDEADSECLSCNATVGIDVQLQTAATPVTSRMGILYRTHLQRRETWSGVLMMKVAMQPCSLKLNPFEASDQDYKMKVEELNKAKRKPAITWLR